MISLITSWETFFCWMTIKGFDRLINGVFNLEIDTCTLRNLLISCSIQNEYGESLVPFMYFNISAYSQYV